MKVVDPKKIIKYSYLALLLAIIGALVYFYFFFKTNVYEPIYFDPEKYPQTGIKESAVNLQKFNEVVSKIDNKKVSEKKNFTNIFK